MLIEEGKFYFIKDEYFNLFKNDSLMINKGDENKRPCFLCLKDNTIPQIIWFIPISHNVEKYKVIYKKK